MWEWIVNIINILLQALGLIKDDGGNGVKNTAKKDSTVNNDSNNTTLTDSTYTKDSNNINITDSEVTIMNQNGHNGNHASVPEEKRQNVKIFTSLFVEKEKIYSEKIEIYINEAGDVEGNVFLDDECTYLLKGTFKNRILTGEYASVESEVDERGTINLKQITEDILSGFCTFSKVSAASDQIRMSPYVWVRGENENLANGTFEFCTQCHKEQKVCCCASEEVDMPILLKNESAKLRERTQKLAVFSKQIGKSHIRQVRKKTTNNVEHCYFYDQDSRECKIYRNRPTDCRLFPFDIKLKKNTDEYWIGYYSELCDRRLPDKDVMIAYAHTLRPQLFLLFPYLDLINRDDVCEKLKDASFEELFKLEDFIF